VRYKTESIKNSSIAILYNTIFLKYYHTKLIGLVHLRTHELAILAIDIYSTQILKKIRMKLE